MSNLHPEAGQGGHHRRRQRSYGESSAEQVLFSTHYSSLVHEADVEIRGGAAGFLAWCEGLRKKNYIEKKTIVVLSQLAS